MMVMMVGLGVCFSGGLSTIVALVNEKIIDVDFLDFLLIPGWGKPKDETDPPASTPTGTGTHCMDTTIEKCKSGDDFTSLYTVDDHDTCVTTAKTECIANGGTWSSANGTYPKNCSAGVRLECVNKRGTERETCADDYRKKCKGSGSGNGGDDTKNGGGTNNGGGSGDQTGDKPTAREICKKYGSNKPASRCKLGRIYYGRCMSQEHREKCDADIARILGV